jgi:hypothetical protein
MNVKRLLKLLDDVLLVLDKLESVAIKAFTLASLVYFLYKIAHL